MILQLIGIISIFLTIIGFFWVVTPGGDLTVNMRAEALGNFLLRVGLGGLITYLIASWILKFSAE